MTENQQLNSVLEICDLHAKRLQYAMKQLKPLIPLSALRFSQLSEAEIPIFELFTSRFAKLQDLMGAKLFGLVLDYAKEPGNHETFLDKLNLLEKIGCIPSAKLWLELREMRNHVSHDYPENPEISAQNINNAFEMATVLLKILESLKDYIRKIEAKY